MEGVEISLVLLFPCYYVRVILICTVHGAMLFICLLFLIIRYACGEMGLGFEFWNLGGV